MGTAVKAPIGRFDILDAPRRRLLPAPFPARASLRRRLDVALERVREIYGARRCLLLGLDGAPLGRSAGARPDWKAGVARMRAGARPFLLRDPGGRWAAWLPLRVKRTLAGVLFVEGEGGTGPAQIHDLRFAGFAAEHIALLLERVRLHEAASRDKLTGLHDHASLRAILRREVRRARRSGGRCGLLLFDLDEFRRINEEHGHDAGSKLLRRIAREITKAVREEDAVARRPAQVGRFGGDEFEVVLPDVPRQAALRRASRVVRSLHARRLSVAGRSIRVSLSAGVATFPEDGETAEELFRQADRALYAAKRGGKNRADLTSANV
jgi:diguanylate cyclase (GGDEF)-like protein